MTKDYNITLDKIRAKAFSVFLHSIGAEFEGSECGEHIYFYIYGMKERLKPIVCAFLDNI